MPTIEQTYIIAGLPGDVWDALINPERIQVWSGKPAEFKPEPGAEYWLWDGDIRGKVLEAETNKRLVQTWKPRNWDIENSVVIFELTPTDEGTQVNLTHENVQDWDYDDTAEGWDTFYLGAIKKMIEGTPVNSMLPNEPRAAKKSSAARKSAPSGNKTKRPTTLAKRATAKKAAKKAAAKKTGKKAAKKTSAKKGVQHKATRKQ